MKSVYMTTSVPLFDCKKTYASRMAFLKKNDEEERFCAFLPFSAMMAYPAPVSVSDPSV